MSRGRLASKLAPNGWQLKFRIAVALSFSNKAVSLCRKVITRLTPQTQIGIRPKGLVSDTLPDVGIQQKLEALELHLRT